MMQTSLLSFTSIHMVVENRISRFIEEYRPRWLYVEFSGGKDSSLVLAASRAVTDSIVATFLHIVGQTHSDNSIAAIKIAERLGLTVKKVICRRRRELQNWFLAEQPWKEAPILVYAIVRDHRDGLDYWSAVEKRGFPAPVEQWGGGKRWCCSLFKSEWFDERPPNGAYQGRRARFIAVGIRREESRFRAKLWRDKTMQVFDNPSGIWDVVLAPIVDLSEADVWSLLKHYGIHDLVKPQYERWTRAPNCALCPLMGNKALENAVSNLPTNYLKRVLRVLETVKPRHKPGTYSAKRIDKWLQLIRSELARRGETID